MTGEVIRRAVKQDEEAVRRLVFSVLAEYGLQSSPETTDADLYDLDGFYKDGVFDVMVDDAGAIIGTVGLKAKGRAVCELRKMYLDPNRRGKGLGAKLLNHAIARARALGFARIELETAGVLEEAIGLYKKFGFSLTKREAAAARCDRFMALDL